MRDSSFAEFCQLYEEYRSERQGERLNKEIDLMFFHKVVFFSGRFFFNARQRAANKLPGIHAIPGINCQMCFALL